ncbi:MAG: ATP-binding protein, partial [Candidatus Altarchaeaceae archaeon]
MEKEKILEILNDWNFWKRDQDTGITREKYLDLLSTYEKTEQIIAIVGVRRAGKSTIMMQYIKNIISKGLVNPENTLYVNFEDRRFYNLSLELLNKIYETYLEYLRPKGKVYIFLDEIQNVNMWEKFVRTLHERKEAQVFISGSSSKLLSSELSTVLTGRTLIINVLPASFKEFLMFKNIKIKDVMDVIDKRYEIKSKFREFMEFGGFPLVILKDNKKEILEGYFDDIIEKDVIQRYKIKNAGKLKDIAKFYLSNISSPVSFNKIKNFLSIPIDTVERYSYYLENACLLFFVKRFSFSLKEQEKSPRKVYCIDTGLRNAISFRFRENLGQLAENIVFLELKRRYKEIYYWKDSQQKEVDFVVKEGIKDIKLIQVCWNVEDYDTKKREINSLLSCMKKLNVNEGTIITEDYEGKEIINTESG